MSAPARSDPRRWLAERRPAPPADLADRLKRRLDRPAAASGGGDAGTGDAGRPGDVPAGFAAPPPGVGPIAADLARHAVSILARLCREPEAPGAKQMAGAGAERAAERDRLRERALELLEADALLTYAFDAASEEGPDAVLATAAWLSPSRLATLLPARAPA